MSILSITNIKKSFGENLVLDDINLSIAENDFYGLVGKNGAGKTTLINIIAGINKPDKGSIVFYDQKNVETIKKRIGLMPDSEGLYKNITGYEFLKYMGKLKKINLSDVQITDLLEKVYLEAPKSLTIKNYSFGMKKKLAIAQTLIGSPELLILDEPTSGVDPESAVYLRQLFKNIHNEGKTILITSHNLSEIEKLCNKVSLLDKGKFIVSGELSSILKRGTNNKKLVINFKAPYSDDEIMNILQNIPFRIKATLTEKKLEIDYAHSNINNILEILLKIKDFQILNISTRKADLEEL
ncbi:TPA: ABC transporter ATP-binding protein, partial [Streptococcus suis]